MCLLALTGPVPGRPLTVLFQKQLLIDSVGEDEVRERARLSSLGLPHAGDWLNTPPLAALGLHLSAAEFVPALKYRLGLPVFTSEGPCLEVQRRPW